MLKIKSTLYLIQVKKMPLITVSTLLFQQLKQGKLRRHVKLRKLEKHRKPKRHVKLKNKLLLKRLLDKPKNKQINNLPVVIPKTIVVDGIDLTVNMLLRLK